MFEKEAERVLKKTSEIIDEAGPRLTGSAAAKRCAAILAEEASAFCDKVTTEVFSVHPGAFLGFVRVMVGFYALSVPLLLIAMSPLRLFRQSLGQLLVPSARAC